jgi:glycosyltransferase involved in cell wall biosynthesis
MAVGTPVVTTTAGGPAEQIDDGMIGLLTPPGELTAWSEAIRSILEYPDSVREMARRGDYITPPGGVCDSALFGRGISSRML